MSRGALGHRAGQGCWLCAVHAELRSSCPQPSTAAASTQSRPTAPNAAVTPAVISGCVARDPPRATEKSGPCLQSGN